MAPHTHAQTVAKGTAAEETTESEPFMTADELFDRSRLLKVEIELQPQDWDTIRRQSRNFLDSLHKNQVPESPFTYVTADITIDGVKIEKVGLRKKGFLGSLDETRPSLKVHFTKFGAREASPIAGVNRLTLNNNKQDAGGFSQMMGYQFFARSGTKASRVGLAHVTVNGDDLGIYSNVESIRKPFLARSFGDGQGALYEGTVVDFYTDYLDRFELKNKRTSRDFLREVTAVLDEQPLDVARLDELVNIDAFVRYWAAESLMGFWDGYTNDQNNYFMYQNPDDSRLYFIPWGLDCAFTENMPLPPFIIKPAYVYSRARLANALYKTERGRQKYDACLKQLLEGHWQEDELLAELERIKTLVKPHIGKQKGPFLGAARRIKKFINKRREQLTEEMSSGYELTKAAHLPAYTRDVGSATATFETQWFDKTPEDGRSVGQAELQLTLNDETVQFQQLGAWAELSKWPVLPGQEKPPSIVFTGVRENGRELTLGISSSISDFAPGEGDAVVINGVIIDGKFGDPKTKMQMVSGTAKLEAAAMTDGAVVKGTLEVAAKEIVDTTRKRND